MYIGKFRAHKGVLLSVHLGQAGSDDSARAHATDQQEAGARSRASARGWEWPIISNYAASIKHRSPAPVARVPPLKPEYAIILLPLLEAPHMRAECTSTDARRRSTAREVSVT